MHVYVPGVLFVDALSCQLNNAYPQGDVSQIYVARSWDSGFSRVDGVFAPYYSTQNHKDGGC